MLYSYAQCIKMFGTDKKLKKALKQKQIYKIEKRAVKKQKGAGQ